MRAKELGFENSFSAYLVCLLEKDLKEHGLQSEQKPPKKELNPEAAHRKIRAEVLAVERRVERRQKARLARVPTSTPSPPAPVQ